MFQKAVLTAALCLALCGSFARADGLRLYIDADYSISPEAAHAIELGVRTALAEVNGRIAGVEVEVSPRNHKANAKRSFKTLRAFLKDPDALAVIGGMHSPPYLTYKDFINDNRILMLLPWSAAGPITRASRAEANWIFRLSVDDSKAGKFLIGQAMDVGGCNSVALLLVDTGWGRANEKTMRAALSARSDTPRYINLYPSGVGAESAMAIAEEVAASGADCVIMLANAAEGANLTMALDHTTPGIRIFSHWAILGADYPRRVTHAKREKMRLRVLQTCGLRVEAEGSAILSAALSEAALPSLADVPAPTGFVHGYDLTQVLIRAAEQAAETPGWAGDIAEKRAALKAALEALRDPAPGILRTYTRPFAPYDTGGPDAHEALGAGDLCLAAFRSDGRLRDATALQ